MKLNILKSLNLKHAIDNTITTIKQLGDNDICVIVPDKLSATMEKLIFEKLDIECSFNINVSTLNRLSKNILAETHAKYRTISKIGGIILLKKVLNENKELITSFKNDKHSYQYSNEIYKTLSQLKACQLSSDELLKYECELKPLQQKINDLGNIMQIYNEAKTEMLDNSDTLTLTCMMLDRSETVKNTYYIFVGFDDFTSQGYLLIERLLKCSKGVYVNTYTSNNFNKNIYYQDVFYRLLAMCQILGAKDNIIEYPYVDDTIHTYLTRNLFAFNKLNFITQPNTIRLYQAQNIVDELEFIARDIRQKVLSGARYREFGLAVYNLNAYTEVIKQVFNKYDLCIYLDVQKGFSSTCVYRFFTNLWQIYAKNYDTLNLIELINSPFIVLPEIHKATIIKTIKQFNYRGNLEKLDCKDEEINQSVDSLHKFLTTYKLDTNSNIDTIIEWHNTIIEQLNMVEIVANLTGKLDDAYDQKIIAQAIKSSNQLLNEIKEFYPNAMLSEILDIYTQAGVELAISPLPLSADCIQVIDANEILTNFDNLYIVNCSSSTAPSILQDVGILLDKELTYVQLSHNIEPTIARMNRLNKFKLFNSALMFNKNLCVSMSLSSPSETSTLVTELKSRIFTQNDKHDEANIGYIYPYQIKSDKIYTPLSVWDLVEYAYTNKIDLSQKVKNLIESTNIQTNPTDITIDKNLCSINEISASALENYFQCPLKYFFSYILKLKEPVSSEIEMLDIGNILHELAYFYYLCKDRLTLDINKFCSETIKKLIEKDEKLVQHINNPILINLIAEAERFILHLRNLDNNSEFVPTYFEKSFGANKSLDALPLTDNISLKGKVDRIDIYNEYFRIIDYKSGNADASLDELYYGKKLQLFLYALAIQNATDKKISGTFYLPIKNVVEKMDSDDNIYKLIGFYTDDNDLINAYDINLEPNSKSEYVNITLKKDGTLSKRSDKVLSPSEMERLMEYSKNVSIKALEEMCCGNFKASPLKFDKTTSACTYCPYLTLCSKSSNSIPFREIGEININSFTGD
ncbi:MAG: PD-(D/E)XK nuclease family protein [Clostridia bacterium]|nr:PD-(D/E)XK nuclease family protein [Clostridia bacterium]